MTTPERLSSALVGRYRIERELGQGGMATVYLAKDLRHDRQVAIKVLRPELAAVIGAERFLREIRTIAGPQHPHILGLIDSGEMDGTAFYVMPFVDGESLRDRLRHEKQLSIAEAVRIATEVASALDYAHRRGVIHRDIKPENILLHDGRALVADFGIALAVSTAGGTRMTETGMSLGTPHYMSPEQALGEREITARSDVYALGCVLYEMLVGEPPFTGPTAQAIIAKVLSERPVSPRISRDTVPAHVEHAVLTSLARLPADRQASAQEFLRSLEGMSAPTGVSTSVSAPASRNRAMSWTPLNTVTSAIAVAAVAWSLVKRQPAEQPAADGPARFVIQPPGGYHIVDAMPGVSDDGCAIVFAAESAGMTRLLVRRMEAISATPLRGTEGTQGGPTITPDGVWILFRQQDRLMRVRVDGTQSPQPVPGAPPMSTIFGPPSVTWQDDGSMILIAELAEGILRIHSSGQRLDTLRLVRRDSGEQGLMYPEVIPGANALLFGVLTRTGWNLHARSLDGSREVTAVPGASRSQFLPPDRVIYSKGGVVYSSRVDTRTLQMAGEATIVATSLPNLQFANSHAAYYAISRTGVLVHLAGSEQPRSRLMLMDRQSGRVTPLRDSVGNRPRFSPDGRFVVAEDSGQVWIHDLARGGTRSLFSTRGLSFVPIWSFDASRIISSTYDGGPAQLWSFSVTTCDAWPRRRAGDTRHPSRRTAASWRLEAKRRRAHDGTSGCSRETAPVPGSTIHITSFSLGSHQMGGGLRTPPTSRRERWKSICGRSRAMAGRNAFQHQAGVRQSGAPAVRSSSFEGKTGFTRVASAQAALPAIREPC